MDRLPSRDDLGSVPRAAHDGSKPGTTAIAVVDHTGLVAVALFNGRPVRGNVSSAVDEVIARSTR